MSELDVLDFQNLRLADLWRPASMASALTCVNLHVAAQRRRGGTELHVLNVPAVFRASLVKGPALSRTYRPCRLCLRTRARSVGLNRCCGA